jgi:hypothetical protein
MTEPAPRIEAAVAAMMDESNIWNDLCNRLSRCSARSLELTIEPSLPSGLLSSSFLRAYNSIVEVFAARCRQGAEQTFAMSGALYTVARSYAAVEEANFRLRGSTPEGSA